MVRPLLILLLCLIIPDSFHPGLYAQQYDRVTVFSGNETVRNNTVTVVPAGVATNSGVFALCDAAFYSIGLDYNGNPGSYTYTFASPITSVRVPMSATNIGELNSFYINGSKYILTAANVDSLKTCDPQYYLQNTTNATGDFIFAGPIIPGTSYYGRFGSGIVVIYVKEGINSIRIENNGVMGGTSYGFFFRGVPLLTRNNSDSICVGDTLKLYAGPTVKDGQYSWTGPDGFSSNEQDPILTPTRPESEGYYIAKVTTPSDTTFDTTWVKFLPNPVATLTTNQPVCLGDTLFLSATADLSGTSYTWSGPDGFSSSLPATFVPQVSQAAAGSYTVVARSGKCIARPVTVDVEILQPSNGRTTTAFICAGNSFSHNGKMYTEEGLYPDTLKGANSKGCDSIIYLNLVHNPAPDVRIEYPNSDRPCLGDTLLLTAYGAQEYHWFHNGQALGAGDSKNVPLIALTNSIILSGKNGDDCSNSDTLEVLSVSCCALRVPNAFSPNGDGNNDQFGPIKGGHLGRFSMKLYNRWGQMVFASYDPHYQWDGTINDQPADLGTYHYIIKAKCPGSEDLEEKGDFLLLR